MKMKASKAEIQVAELLTKGCSVKEIAGQLYRSPHTIDSHIKNIKKKNGLKNIADIVREYIVSHPNKFFKTLVVAIFITIQCFITFGDMDIELRRPNKAQRTQRAKRKDNTI